MMTPSEGEPEEEPPPSVHLVKAEAGGEAGAKGGGGILPELRVGAVW